MCNQKTNSNGLFIILIGIAISLFLFYYFTGSTKRGHLSDAELAAHRYCYMVFNGQWPDYQQNYGQFCVAEKWNGK